MLGSLLNALLVAAIVLQPVVCFGESNGWFKEYYDEGYSTGNMENNKRHGKWKEFRYELENNGEEYLYCAGDYKDGKQHGEWKWFHKNGDLSSAGNYRDGKQHGEWKWFHENGNLSSVKNYEDGRELGEWKEFYENGDLKFARNYKGGKPHGEWKEFYENGNLKFAENYKDGKPYGEWKVFDENGKLIKADSAGVGTKGIFADKRDGNKYKTVKIGIRTWTAENLNYDESGSVCYDNKPENCDKYGKLYYWNAAKEACPSGWHLPSSEEWQKLVDIAGGYDIAGKKLKARSGWADDGNGTDEYGFSAMPGGSYDSVAGHFGGIGYNGNWWSASVSEFNVDSVYVYNMGYDFEYADYHWNYKSALLSIRCIQDLENNSSTIITDCGEETAKAKAIYFKCVRMDKNSNEYAECANNYKNQKNKAQRICGDN